MYAAAGCWSRTREQLSATIGGVESENGDVRCICACERCDFVGTDVKLRLWMQTWMTGHRNGSGRCEEAWKVKRLSGYVWIPATLEKLGMRNPETDIIGVRRCIVVLLVYIVQPLKI